MLLVDLGEQRAADEPRPDQAHGQWQGRQVEAAVHGAQRALRVLLVDQHRDVVLAAPLRDRPAHQPQQSMSIVKAQDDQNPFSIRCWYYPDKCAGVPELDWA